MTATQHPLGRTGRWTTSPHPGWAAGRIGPGRGPAAAARWLLLGAVIAGVLAMHILSAADSGGNHQPMAMAMTPDSDSSAGMSMGLPMQTAELVAASYPITATQLSGGPGAGMSPMTCCVLAFVSAAGLLLLLRSTTPATNPAADRIRGRAAASAAPQRGPPGQGRPRIALSVLRV